MTQPTWITPAGSLGVIPVGVFYQTTLFAIDDEAPELYYTIIAGRLPDGVQCSTNGLISGVPNALASLQGLPLPVSRDTTSKFTVRAYDEEDPTKFADRTFTLTVAIAPGPLWTTPEGSVGTYYDSDEVDFQFQFTESYEPNTTVVELLSGQLPGGLILSANGRLQGYIEPTADVNALPGYDLTAQSTEPYDFVSQAQSKNFQFTLKVTDGNKFDLRTFTIFVYSRDEMLASDGLLINTNTFITADETTERAPFLLNAVPSNIGTHRSNNHFAYQFVGKDYDSTEITYAISVNQGVGLPPGLNLDPVSGWYYGYIPDQGITETEYSFNIVVYQTAFANPRVTCVSTQSGTNVVTVQGTGQLSVGQPMVFDNNFGGLIAGTTYYVASIVSENTVTNRTEFTLTGAVLTTAVGEVSVSLVTECTATASGTNEITCSTTEYIGVGQPIVFTGTEFGGITAAAQIVYYVSEIVDATHFKISRSPSLTSNTGLATATGIMYANLIVASQAYPFVMTITGAVESEVTWLTDSDLGSIVNGATSILKVEAENRGGRIMLYRLKPGAGPDTVPTPYIPGVFNQLPQGLQLLPSGDIVGRVSFDTFSLDLGATTIDQSFAINRNLASLGTTFDSTFTFTVNAYAPETNQLLYEVSNVIVNNGGTGYSTLNPPTIEFSSPVGASAVTALAGNVTISAGVITSVDVADPGAGYVTPATVTITQGFGGSNANLSAEMRVTGSRDAISVFKTFTIRVVREYNKPYQNLYVRAMPPLDDRALIRTLLDNQEIFVPEYIYRPDDINFGKSRQVTYYHAFGLEPDTLETYVSSLYENHYWKNLVLGQIETAQALDADGNVIYEVVYSKIIDNLVNNQDQSVGKVVPLPYAVVDPATGSTVIAVFPNSLVNMRNQVIDVVGQLSNVLPAWMTSKQSNGRVLGFVPAWVIAYTKPGRSKQIAYNLQTLFGTQLNQIDFKVDRYILDRSMSKNWNTTTQSWTPAASETTFDLDAHYQFTDSFVVNTGLGYELDDEILILGSQIGGEDGVNDVTIRVNTVDGTGAITGAFVSGNASFTELGNTYTGISGTNLVGSGTGATWDFVVVGVDQTVFDADSVRFIAPVDMYDPTDTFDKYLVFPKSNILV
jgi:hypothetical protein